MFNSLRIRENMPTRRKKNRLKPVQINSARGKFSLEHKNTLAIRPIIELPLAGFLQNPPNREGGFVGAKLSTQMSQPLDINAQRNIKFEEMQFNQIFDLESLARLYAKICHGYAVALFGIDRFTPWLPPYILGQDNHLSYVVGGATKNESKYPSSYQISWSIHNIINGHKNVIIFDLRLFANLGGPWSQVIVGTAHDDLCEDLKLRVTV